ncbi:MAG: apolipoprotein N-acyltransferase [Planctomycetota bacterium]
MKPGPDETDATLSAAPQHAPASEATSRKAGLPWPAVLGLLLLGAALRFVVLDGHTFPGSKLLTLLCAAPTIWACVEARALRSLLPLALLTELALWLLLARWLAPVSPAGALGAGAYLGVYSTLSLLAIRAVGRKPWPLAVTLPAVWVMFDLLRSHIPFNGFPWFYLAHGMTSANPNDGAPILAQCASLFGQHAVTAIAVCVGAAIVEFMRWRRKTGSPLAVRISGTVAAGVLMAAGIYGGWTLQGTAGGKHPQLHVAAIQTNVPQSNRNAPTLDSLAQDWADLLELTRQAGRDHPGAELIVWPETSTYFPINDAAVDAAAERWRNGDRSVDLFERMSRRAAVERLARELDTPILIGSSAQDPVGEDPRVGPRANSALLIRPDTGLDPGRFDKQHLVPFGEYIPGPGWLRRLVFDHFNPYENDYRLTPGPRVVRFQVQTDASDDPAMRTVTLATPICFEDVVPRATRRIARGPAVLSSGENQNEPAPPADVLINLTNDGWFAGTPQPRQHLRMATLRCIELRTPMLRCVNTGITAAIRANGHVHEAAPQGVAGVHLYAIPLAANPVNTLYARLGDGPAWAFSSLGALLLLRSLLPARPPTARTPGPNPPSEPKPSTVTR